MKNEFLHLTVLLRAKRKIMKAIHVFIFLVFLYACSLFSLVPLGSYLLRVIQRQEIGVLKPGLSCNLTADTRRRETVDDGGFFKQVYGWVFLSSVNVDP